MFDTITRHGSDVATKNRVLTTGVAVLAHLAILTALLVVPLWYFTPALPSPSEIMAFVAAPPLPPPPPPPPPPAAAPARQARHEPVKAMPSADRFAAPIEVPSRIEPEKLADTRGTTGVLGGVEGGIEGGVVGGIVGGLSSALPPPPPPPAPPPAKPAPVRIGGQIMAPALISRVDPVYPAIAQAAQLEGIVILEATVGETGRSRVGQGAAFGGAAGCSGGGGGETMAILAATPERSANLVRADRHRAVSSGESPHLTPSGARPQSDVWRSRTGR